MVTVYQQLIADGLGEELAGEVNAVATTLFNWDKGLTLERIAEDLEFRRKSNYPALLLVNAIQILENKGYVYMDDTGVYKLTEKGKSSYTDISPSSPPISSSYNPFKHLYEFFVDYSKALKKKISNKTH